MRATAWVPAACARDTLVAVNNLLVAQCSANAFAFYKADAADVSRVVHVQRTRPDPHLQAWAAKFILEAAPYATSAIFAHVSSPPPLAVFPSTPYDQASVLLMARQWGLEVLSSSTSLPVVEASLSHSGLPDLWREAQIGFVQALTAVQEGRRPHIWPAQAGDKLTAYLPATAVLLDRLPKVCSTHAVVAKVLGDRPTPHKRAGGRGRGRVGKRGW